MPGIARQSVRQPSCRGARAEAKFAARSNNRRVRALARRAGGSMHGSLFSPGGGCFACCLFAWEHGGWKSSNESIQGSTILGGDGNFKLAFQTFALQSIFPAAQFCAQIGTATGFFAGRIQEYMPIWCPDHAQEFAFGLVFTAGNTRAHRDMFDSFWLSFCHAFLAFFPLYPRLFVVIAL